MDKELRLLLIEDVPTDAELEVRELKRAGLRVAHRVVETEEAFRRELAEFRPSVIISDFSMPQFDGMWALSLARELVPDTPFIFVSGTIGEEYAIRALRNGATDYVLKNNLVRLPAAVERALQDREVHAARRRAEEETRHQRAFLRQVIDLDRSLIFAEDREGRFVLVNQATAELLGTTVDAMLGKTIKDFPIDPELAERLYADCREVIETQRELFLAEERIVDAAGQERWFQMVKRPIFGADGKADMVLGVATDITERKSQELRIARLSRIHAVLSGINSAIVRIRERQNLLEEICRIAVEQGGFGMVWVGDVDQKTFAIRPVASAGLEAKSFLASSESSADPETPMGRGIVGRAVRERRPVYSNDILTETTQGGARRREAMRRGYRSIIALPLILGGRATGSLSLFAKEPGFFDDEEIKLLAGLADDISFALESMERRQQLEKLSRIRAVSSEVNAAIARVRDRPALIEEICRIATARGGFELVWIGAVDERAQEIRAVAWAGFSPEVAQRVSWKSTTAAQGTLAEAIRTRKASVRNDIESELPGGGMRGEALKRGCGSTVCLPVVVDDGVAALIALFAAGKGFFDDDELALLEEMSADLSLALQSIARQERVEFLSYYDALTGLPNRQLFVDRLSQQTRGRGGEQRMVALILFDLERFRNINDTLGRGAGDELLKAIARRLERAFNGRDYLSHIGADTFGAVVRGVRDASEIAHVVESQVFACFRDPLAAGGTQLHVSPRAGVALHPADGGDADTLFRNAEAALKKAKASGERFLFYAPQMNERVAEQLKLENDLRDAMQQEQFVLHYQPKFDLATGRLAGMEALIRWKHPERGLVSPGSFVPVLEETGMILEAGRWALKHAALEHAGWAAEGLKPPRIAVNVSPAQLRRRDFVDYIKEALADVPQGAERLDIEITESMLMEDVAGSIAKLKEVQALGINVAIDDFGTGYSSLSYLARLPINSLKIDRSFVVQMPSSPEQMAIVSTVISLARALNLKVVAEGVETEEQANLLRLLRCDEVQGYLFGRPVPAPEIEKLLKS